MRNRKNIEQFKNLAAAIAANPTKDFDDYLFSSLLELTLLGKEAVLSDEKIIDNGREYLFLKDEGEGRTISFYDLFSSFVDEFVDYDGFVLERLFIEKDFIEEIISAIDMSQITVVKGNIVGFEGDAVVNAANSSLLGGGGVDGAIHDAAGPELYKECLLLNGCNTGDAKITKAYDMKCSHVIHTVGPVYTGSESDPVKLSSCYRRSLEVARENGLKSIAFPLISTGVYGYPLKDAIKVALEAVLAYLEDHPDYPMYVVFYCFDEKAYEIFAQLQ